MERNIVQIMGENLNYRNAFIISVSSLMEHVKRRIVCKKTADYLYEYIATTSSYADRIFSVYTDIRDIDRDSCAKKIVTEHFEKEITKRTSGSCFFKLYKEIAGKIEKDIYNELISFIDGMEKNNDDLLVSKMRMCSNYFLKLLSLACSVFSQMQFSYRHLSYEYSECDKCAEITDGSTDIWFTVEPFFVWNGMTEGIIKKYVQLSNTEDLHLIIDIREVLDNEKIVSKMENIKERYSKDFKKITIYREK